MNVSGREQQPAMTEWNHAMLPHECVEETSISLSPTTPPPPERRTQQRHLTILRVGALIVDGTRELCLVRNISAGGVMAHVYRDLPIGTRVEIEIKNDEPLPGKIVWADDANVGIAFDTKIDVPDLLATSKIMGEGKRARRPRVCVDRMAKVRCGAQVAFVHARDVSQGGVKIDTDHPFPVDADVVVTLDGFRPLPGIVRWRREGQCGISFIQVIPIQELCDWLRMPAAS
jgi:hypothetical protein